MADNDHLIGHVTQLALANFRVSRRPMPLPVIHALAEIKASLAAANGKLSAETGVDTEMAEAIRAAALEVTAGHWDDHFAVDAFQTGSGTSTNMNVNEVIAALASRRLPGRTVHPNDHVNASQSTNDAFPTAIRIAALIQTREVLLPGLRTLRDALDGRRSAFAHVVKAGRTHLMDASPVTLGQEFGGYHAQIVAAIERIEATMARLAEVPLGGTATGNGLNCPAAVAATALDDLAARTGLPLMPARNRFAAQGSQDDIVEFSGQVRVAAVAAFKIANDIRLLASGPRTGLGEIHLPELQPGSSIMPGKVNPILCEVVTQVAAQVIGHDAAIAFAGSQGTLELNTYLPVIALNLLDSISLLGRATSDFAARCVAGIEADEARCRALAELSPSVATALNLVIGYDAATDVVRQALDDGRSVRDVLLERRLLTSEQIDAALDLDKMAKGNPQLEQPD